MSKRLRPGTIKTIAICSDHRLRANKCVEGTGFPVVRGGALASLRWVCTQRYSCYSPTGLELAEVVNHWVIVDFLAFGVTVHIR